METKQGIVLAGGSGFLGKTLANHLTKQGHAVVVLTRSPVKRNPQVKEVYWDGRELGEWAAVLEGALAVVNLAGRSVNCRYHARNRQAILESRIRTTRVLGDAIARCAQPPCVWLNSSTATIYKHSLDQAMDETTGVIAATREAKDAFSVEVARAWEQTLSDAPTPATRKVALRTAMVLGPGKGGVFRVLRRLVRFGLGGRMASGNQFVSWIHEQDFCRAIDWLVAREDLSGPVNLAAPGPVPNREMMKAFRRVCGVPIGLPATRWMLELGACALRTETELILKSRRVIPARLMASGFEFHFPKLEEALWDLESRLS
jgi:uncharacterized protein (TIGR01777 family)